MFRLTVVTAFFALLRFSAASPGGAPVCPADESAPGSPHRGAGFTEGTIPESNLIITIDGNELEVDTPLDLFVGQTYEVTISTDTFFRGVLVRMAGGDAEVDTVGLFEVTDGDTDLQVSTPCTISGVAGVTHRNRSDKTSITFFMALDEPSTNMALDVNVVESNPNPSVFYYSQYLINAVPAPTAAPTFTPTSIPTVTPTSAPTSTPTVAPTSAPTMPLVSIYETGVAANLTVATFAAAAGLGVALSDPNASLTLLAPVNEAFDELPPRVVQYLIDNPDTLRAVLLGHVLPSVEPAEAVVSLDGQDVIFLNNVSQTVSVSTEGVFITAGGDAFDGVAQVVQTDIFATNGVIHLINRILGVPTLAEAANEGGAAVVTALEGSGLASQLDTLDGITLFVPTTPGFLSLSALYPEMANAVLTNPGVVLHVQALLLAHLAPDVFFSEDLVDGTMVTMSTGDNFTIGINETVTISPGSVDGVATVIEPFDVITTQGVVHTINALLIPAFLTRTIVDIAIAETSTLASLVVRAGLDDTLATTFGLTVFAPNDAAFDKFDEETLNFLQSDEGLDTLTEILQYHVLSVGTLVPSILVVTGSVNTLLGRSIEIEVTDAGAVVLNEMSTVVATDALANNGIVHIIDTVLTIPPTEAPTGAPTLSPTVESTTSPTTAPAVDPSSSAYMASGVCAYFIVAAFLALI